MALLLAGTTSAWGQGAAAGSYFGQKPPGEIPVAFASEFLAERYGFVTRIAFSPDGTECCFTVTDATFSQFRLMITQCEAGRWTVPVVAPFTHAHARSLEPFFSKNGRKLYFSSDGEASSPTNKRDLWMTERKSEGWSEPERLPSPINSEYNELFLSQAADGTVYFLSNRPGGHGGFDVYRTRQEPGQPLKVENLGAPVNSPADEWDPCIAPDGRFLVFVSGRPGGHGGADLYVSFDDERGGWTVPVNLGEGFNTPANEFTPSFSPDGRFLFFSRLSPQGGDVYWVSTTAIERLNPLPKIGPPPAH